MHSYTHFTPSLNRIFTSMRKNWRITPNSSNLGGKRGANSLCSMYYRSYNSRSTRLFLKLNRSSTSNPIEISNHFKRDSKISQNRHKLTIRDAANSHKQVLNPTTFQTLSVQWNASKFSFVNNQEGIDLEIFF